MSATSNFQTWLIKARRKSEWTYAQLAIKSGVSTATIHALEHSGGSPSLDTVEKLCKALGTSVEAALRVRTAKPSHSNIFIDPAAITGNDTGGGSTVL